MKEKTLDELMLERFADGVEKVTGRLCPDRIKKLCCESRGENVNYLIKYLLGERNLTASADDVVKYLKDVFFSRDMEVYWKREEREGMQETRFRARFDSISAEKTKAGHHSIAPPTYSLTFKGPNSAFTTCPIELDYMISPLMPEYYFELVLNSETNEPEALDFVVHSYNDDFKLVLRRNGELQPETDPEQHFLPEPSEAAEVVKGICDAVNESIKDS